MATFMSIAVGALNSPRAILRAGLCTLAIPMSPALADSSAPYSVSGPAYTGPHATPQFHSLPGALDFRTRIIAASREAPNFAGRYVLSWWGCGTGCSQGIAVNVQTGAIAWLPASYVLEPGSREPQYSITSRLLILTSHDGDNDETPYAPRCYVLDDTDFPQFIKKTCAAIGSAHPPTAKAALYQKGLDDRGIWEQWFSSLHGDFKVGAFYWASQRSLAHPGSCEQMDADFLAGCTAAKERLAADDAMRQSAPTYKLGWNAWGAPPSTPPVAVPAPPPTDTAAAALASDTSEQKLIAIVDGASAAYASAPNEMAQGAVRVVRAHALATLFPDGEVHDWVGTVETLSSTDDGRGILAIRISPHIVLATENNRLSESLAPQHTLIATGSPLWVAAVHLSAGQRVEFSGRLSPGADYLEETSLTVGGGMSDPNFIMRFTSVRPLRDGQ